ncbi:MAG: hypothetical protein ABIG64_02380 [Candidatus Omnitrophota bacterium]
MFTKENILLAIKSIFICVLIFLAIKFGIPAIKAFDQFFTLKIKSFLSLFFEGAGAVKKQIKGKQNEYLETDYEINYREFRQGFMRGITDDDLTKAIGRGNFLIAKDYQNLQIRRKLAFLYYLENDYAKSKEHYYWILKRFSENKLKFENIRSHEYVYSIKRCLLELAALSYEGDNVDQAFSFYWQFKRADYPEDTFYELRNQNLSSQDILVEIFTMISREGGFSLKKSIQGLELLNLKYPDDPRIISALIFEYLEIIEFLGEERILLAWEYIQNLAILAEAIPSFKDEELKNELQERIEILPQIKEKYERALSFKLKNQSEK